MKTHFNEESHKFEWVLDKWHQKLALVLGYIWIGAFSIGFIAGFVGALFN